MEQTKKHVRALLLMSGGLDSLLAAKMLQEQGIDVTPICFESYFFSCAAATRAAKELGLNLRVVDISDPQLAIVKNPKHGRGKAVNPCIDCHLLMLKTAKKIMEQEGFDFIATGEVLEERPMSQNRRAMDLILREAELEGKLLRPLSAKVLPATEAEARGLVGRAMLGAISGRSRTPQLEMAAKYNLKDIPQPSGGCILTETDYADKLFGLINIHPDFDGNDARVLRHGRIFFENGALVAVARDKGESENLPRLAKENDIVFLPENFSGPTVLVRDFGKNSEDVLKKTGTDCVMKYSKKIPAKPEITALVIKNDEK